jgi:hypothetical protein
LQRLTASANNISPLQLTARMEKGGVIESLEDVWDGSPWEAGHTGAGIKPRGRYDRAFDAHHAVRCCDEYIDVRPPLGFPRCCTDGQPTLSPSFPHSHLYIFIYIYV